MIQVALVRCETYDNSAVREAVKRGVALLGGPGKFVRMNEKILLKPNFLVGKSPDKCVNTHPAVFRAVAEMCIQEGAKVWYGDQPGIGTSAGASKKIGITPIAEELGVAMADFTNGRDVQINGAIIQDEFHLAEGVFQSDGIISLPKLKAHKLTKMTGAVKNQYGCIVGLQKKGFHMKYADARDFSKMLVDLNRAVQPRLYIMDGIRGMEGNGPQNGDPVAMNVLLFSTDPIAMDATVCRMVDIEPEYLLTNLYGMEADIGTYREDEIELLGDGLEGFRNYDFDVERGQIKPFKGSGGLSILSNLRVPKPAILGEKCVECGICIEACPAAPKALGWGDEGKNEPPEYDYGNCIRCYCCQEMCPEGAVYLKYPVFSGKKRKLA